MIFATPAPQNGILSAKKVQFLNPGPTILIKLTSTLYIYINIPVTDNILGQRYSVHFVPCQVLPVVTLQHWRVTTDPYPHIPPYMSSICYKYWKVFLCHGSCIWQWTKCLYTLGLRKSNQQQNLADNEELGKTTIKLKGSYHKKNSIAQTCNG